METISALLAICAGNSPVPGEFPTQRPVTRSFDVFFDLRLNNRLSKQSWRWWLETLSRPLKRHYNVAGNTYLVWMFEIIVLYSLKKMIIFSKQSKEYRHRVFIGMPKYASHHRHHNRLYYWNYGYYNPAFTECTLNSLRPRDAYMRRWNHHWFI